MATPRQWLDLGWGKEEPRYSYALVETASYSTSMFNVCQEMKKMKKKTKNPKV